MPVETVHQRGAALVTGAAGSIGSAIARRLSRDGYRVACTDSDADRLGSATKDLSGAAGFACDVRSADEVARLRDSVTAWAGPPSLVVNAAGVFTLCRVPDMPEALWDDIIDINLKGTFLMCKAFLPAMIEAHSGVIVNISSMSGLGAARDRAAYAASKAGVVLFSRSLAVDHGPDGIRVNCVCPGLIDTPMASWIRDDEPVFSAWVRDLPAGRIGTVEDIASAVAFLASDESSYIYGATLVVDGGGSA
jgi:meso-butanediol dehydrogenase / (S,S)-butanediol dehydrogenase / diacetyl reductase